MSSEDVLIRLSVVFKKFGLIANELLPVICQFFNVGIQSYILVDDIQTIRRNINRVMMTPVRKSRSDVSLECCPKWARGWAQS